MDVTLIQLLVTMLYLQINASLNTHQKKLPLQEIKNSETYNLSKFREQETVNVQSLMRHP